MKPQALQQERAVQSGMPRGLSAYQQVANQTSVATASPVDLILLVYGKVLDQLIALRLAIETKQDSTQVSERLLDLIEKGLVAALDRKSGGAIADNLASLYDWSTRQILLARVRSDGQIVGEVIEVFRNLESAWQQIRDASAASKAPEFSAANT